MSWLQASNNYNNSLKLFTAFLFSSKAWAQIQSKSAFSALAVHQLYLYGQTVQFSNSFDFQVAFMYIYIIMYKVQEIF